MAFIGIEVPPDVEASLSALSVPGERTPSGQFHVTMLYLGKQTSTADILRATAVCCALAERTPPFRVGTAVATSFPAGDEGKVPVIARVVSPALHELQAAMRKAFDELGIEYSKRHPEYKPHVTLSYAPGTFPDSKIVPVTWTCSQLAIWGGEDGPDDRIATRVTLLG